MIECQQGMLSLIVLIVKQWGDQFLLHPEHEDSWVFKVCIWNQGDPEIVNLDVAKERYRKAFAWYAMEKKLLVEA